MTSFSSQLGTKSAPGELIPFGWTRKDNRFRNTPAETERARAQEQGRAFGRREALPEKQSLLKYGDTSPASRTQRFAPSPMENTLLPHPRLLFTRSR